MAEQLISFKTAKLADEKRLNLKKAIDSVRRNWYTRSGNLNGYTPKEPYYAVPQSLLQTILRDDHDLDMHVLPVRFTGYLEIGYFTYAIKGIQPVKNYRFKTWEEALEEGLQEALKKVIV